MINQKNEVDIINQFQDVITSLIQHAQNAIVVYSALWPFMRIFNLLPQEIPEVISDLFIKLTGEKINLLMPTFTTGYKDGICNLDVSESTTGLLSETFRLNQKSKRTLSAFFSFNVIGPDQEYLCNLRPEDAWGDGSLYHWMEEQDVTFLMLGTHPTHCSYLHRMEWLIKDQINYRYVKQFAGKIIRESDECDLKERLFVRSLKPSAINDFTVLEQILLDGGMEIIKFHGINISVMKAKKMKESTLHFLMNDPYGVLKNREDFEKKVITHE